MYKKMILLLGEAADEEQLESLKEALAKQELEVEVETLPFSQFDTALEDSLYLLYLSDLEIKELFSKEMSQKLSMAILPNKLCPSAMRSYGISKNIAEAIEDVFNENEAVTVDLLKCNGKPVIGSIVIGNVHGMNRPGNKYKNVFEKIPAFFSDLRSLTFKPYTINTAKGNITNTAATGIMIFEHNISGVSHNLLNENISLHDGRVHALILAPTSVVGYLYYLVNSYFFNKILSDKLPESIGFLASTSFEITSSGTIEYVSDGELLSDDRLVLEVVKDALRLHLGRNITDIPVVNGNKEEEKEMIRVKSLPKEEQIAMLVGESMPFLPRASEEDFKELFVGLRQSAKVSSVYLTLMVLSTLLATTGLFQSSAPVIIGAMILAPLMAPIVSFAMGVVRGEKELLQESAATLLIGIVTALAFSCLYTYLMPLTLPTDEMSSRLNPNILDLMVAIISGVAGAYAYAKAEVAKSLAGVAIAVALIPPLSVVGIGIGWGDTQIIYGSFLLFMTNLAGITLSAALTFLIMGFTPVKRATKGIVLTSLFLLIVTIPLFVSFGKLVEQNRILRHLKAVETVNFEDRNISIRTISVDLSREMPVIYIKARSTSALKEEELQKIKLHISTLLSRPIILDVLPEIEL